jgi:hypothetical protein
MNPDPPRIENGPMLVARIDGAVDALLATVEYLRVTMRLAVPQAPVAVPQPDNAGGES